MKQFFITGTSSGIGQALAWKALENGHRVTGISRRKNIVHDNYKHLPYDLSQFEDYHLINFNVNKEAEEVILINNAGWLGDVKPLGKISPENIERSFQINLIAPAILSKLFIAQTQSTGQQRTLLNISSGVAKYPIRSWSTYCASKAGLESLTEVTQLDHPDVKCFAVAPGIVDTEMQGEIRQMEQDNFPDIQRFLDYKKRGDLADPKVVADKLLDLISSPKKSNDSVFSLRDL